MLDARDLLAVEVLGPAGVFSAGLLVALPLAELAFVAEADARAVVAGGVFEVPGVAVRDRLATGDFLAPAAPAAAFLVAAFLVGTFLVGTFSVGAFLVGACVGGAWAGSLATGCFWPPVSWPAAWPDPSQRPSALRRLQVELARASRPPRYWLSHRSLCEPSWRLPF